jgi:hypothetical protein
MELYRVFRFALDWLRNRDEANLDKEVEKLITMQLGRLPG